MPLDTLDDASLHEALRAVGLSHLAERLDDTGHWAHQLSPGEQQRIAFARALVQKPEWLFLDEATAAVDEPTEQRLYRLLGERLPDTTVFSVGHRRTLLRFHARQLVVQRSSDSAGRIVEVRELYTSVKRTGAVETEQ
jgi:putative ATP-binding cassette transporter